MNKNWVIKQFKPWWFDDRYCWTITNEGNDAPKFQRLVKQILYENKELFERLSKI